MITREAEINLQANDEQEKARLTSWLVEERRLGIDAPEVTPLEVEDAKSRRRLSVHERADRLLRGIWRLADVADTFERRREDWERTWYRLAWSESIRVEEIDYLLDYMQRVGWTEERFREGSGVVSKHGISIDGHARLAALEQVNSDSSKAFVAMWFHESMDEVWKQAIGPGIADAGYEAVRIDRKEHVNKIDDEIDMRFPHGSGRYPINAPDVFP